MKADTAPILEFLQQIGLDTRRERLDHETFLPGIDVRKGTLLYDPERLSFAGDLLHEAGHLAVLPPEERSRSDGDFSGNDGCELGAIAWSYSAAVKLELPLERLFHPDGYKGDSAWLVETFSNGRYPGLPILEWRGMTNTNGRVYPQMQHWLCPASEEPLPSAEEA